MAQQADVCLILEGTYPYVTGGVASWTHELIQEQSHLTFHVCAIVPRDEPLELKYHLPQNVVGMTTIRLQDLPEGGTISDMAANRLHARLAPAVDALAAETRVELDTLRDLLDALNSTRTKLGTHVLLDHEAAWEKLTELYDRHFQEQSFLDFFWSYRAIVGSIYSILLAELPKARLYHAMSTGYAGLLAARAKVETGQPMVVTEHGIYTNERRIEIVSADWLEATASRALTIDKPRRELRDFWTDSVDHFSQFCYQAADRIVTLFEGNQRFQAEDGADPAKMQIIANGIDLKRFNGNGVRRQSVPTIGLIGRVVPIKDVKTFIRACGLLRQFAPDLRAYVVGSTDGDPLYFQECENLVQLLGLEANVNFTGHANVEDYLKSIDILVLTSLSEAQPLVVLEAGACGIPVVATDVGACRELILGRPDEEPSYGEGGAIAALASPASVAESIYGLLTDNDRYESASRAIRERVQNLYNKSLQQNAYRELYGQFLKN